MSGIPNMTPWSLRTAVTSDKNCEKILKFSTKWYTKLCILVDPVLRNCLSKSNFRYFLKKGQKKALTLKGLIDVVALFSLGILVTTEE